MKNQTKANQKSKSSTTTFVTFRAYKVKTDPDGRTENRPTDPTDRPDPATVMQQGRKDGTQAAGQTITAPRRAPRRTPATMGSRYDHDPDGRTAEGRMKPRPTVGTFAPSTQGHHKEGVLPSVGHPWAEGHTTTAAGQENPDRRQQGRTSRRTPDPATIIRPTTTASNQTSRTNGRPSHYQRPRQGIQEGHPTDIGGSYR